MVVVFTASILIVGSVLRATYVCHVTWCHRLHSVLPTVPAYSCPTAPGLGMAEPCFCNIPTCWKRCLPTRRPSPGPQATSVQHGPAVSLATLQPPSMARAAARPALAVVLLLLAAAAMRVSAGQFDCWDTCPRLPVWPRDSANNSAAVCLHQPVLPPQTSQCHQLSRVDVRATQMGFLLCAAAP